MKRILVFTLSMYALSTQAQNVQVLSATVKDEKIDHAKVILQKNGAQSVVGYTDQNGKIKLTAPFKDDNSALLIIKKDGYSTLVAKCPCNNLVYALSPVLNNLDAMRVVLSWGETPSDLDAHVNYNGNHIYWDSKIGQNANLDVDDIDSYGPETITIDKRQVGKDYIFSIHDFTDRQDPTTLNLANSGARVFVYVGQSLVKTYYVPKGMKGNLWSVFKMTLDGQITDINRMSGLNIDPSGMNWEIMNNASEKGADAPVLSNSDEAEGKNKAGENFYRAGNYELAIATYQQAIDLDSKFGQAYSNLGLAYQKSGMKAEAIWANRKAIEFGNATTKANSYYNIGRIYEGDNDYANALSQYKLAKEFNNSSEAYNNAINRVSNK